MIARFFNRMRRQTKNLNWAGRQHVGRCRPDTATRKLFSDVKRPVAATARRDLTRALQGIKQSLRLTWLRLGHFRRCR